MFPQTLSYQAPLKKFLLRSAQQMKKLLAHSASAVWSQVLMKDFEGAGQGLGEWEAIEVFFAKERYEALQERLKAVVLATRAEEKALKAAKGALEVARAGYFLHRRRLSFEISDRVLQGRGAYPILEVDEKGRVQTVHSTVSELEERLKAGMLCIKGVERRESQQGLCFVAGPGTSPHDLFSRALLECDPQSDFIITGGREREQEAEQLVLLCMANQLRWYCDRFDCHDPRLLQQAIDALPPISRSHPCTVYQGLSKQPKIQSYYLNHCLALDVERLYEVYADLEGVALDHFQKQCRYPDVLSLLKLRQGQARQSLYQQG